jgi:tetratricopeptide (TPR) repeat protein
LSTAPPASHRKPWSGISKPCPCSGKRATRRGEANALISIGNVYSATSQPQKALESYQQALPLYRQAGDKRGEAGVLTNIGNVYRDTGQPQKALESYQQALPLHRQVGHKAHEATR